ncbi:unnamed protein product [Calypogeia fissa]
MRLLETGMVVLLILKLLSCSRRSQAVQAGFEPEWEKGALSLKFYAQTCPQVESVVQSVFTQYVQQDITLMGSLLRMAYHDCFVQGCDASILLDSTPTQQAEKWAPPNLGSVRGYEVYDAIKAALEQPSACPGVVSCADIIALVARDSVKQASGIYWAIYLGRRDGMTSSATLATSSIPGPTSTYSQLMSAFTAIGLSQHDLVTLSGAHTIGRTHCSNIMKRLYNFSGLGDTDPALNPAYAAQLKQQCSQGSPSATVPMDSTEFVFDNNYYDDLVNNKGLFNSDVQLLTQRFPASVVADYVTNGATSFFPDFQVSMQRMLVANVLTGTEGEVRKNCRVVNS